jgi:uncharacterized protein involved in outer membrane biogenesis
MRLLGLLRQIPRPRLVATLAALFAAYLVLGFYVLPRYLQRAIPEQVTGLLKRQASLGEVHVNPLLFRVELRDFMLAETDGAPLVEFRRLLIDFEASSLARWAWTFSNVTLEGLEVRAEIAPDGSFNLAELADSLPKGEAPAESEPSRPPPRLLLQHFALVDAAVLFSDRSGARPAVASLRPLAIELRELSTLPDRRGPYSVAARLPGGATLAWRGEISLAPILSLGEISLRSARPGAFWRFFEDELRLAAPAGSVELGLRYRAAYTAGTPELTVEDIRFSASDLALTERGAKEPFFALKAAAISGGRFDLGRRELRLPSVELRGGVLRVETDADGVLNLQKLVVASPPAAQAPRPAPARTPRAQARPWQVKLDSVRLAELALQYRDLSRIAPLAFGVGNVDIGLSAALETGANGTQVTVNELAVALSRVTLGEVAEKEPLVDLQSVGLQGGSFDLRNQDVAVRRVAVTGGRVKVVRETDGGMRLLDVMKKKAPQPAPAPAAARAAAKPWRFALDAFDVAGLKIAVADRGLGKQPVAYDIDPLTLGLKNLRTEGKTPARLEAALRIAQGGSLRLSAEASPAGNWSRASARATLERLSLKPLQPAVASRTSLALESGEVSATFEAQVRATKKGTEVRGSGTASLDDLLVNEAGSGERFLEWKSVAASAISLAPDRLAIGDITVRGLGAKVLIDKNRRVNLEALKPPASATPPEPVPQAAPPAAAAGEFPVSIERVRVQKAAVDFSDLSLILPFAAKIQELDGTVLGMSTDRASRAIAQLEGRVDEFGLARIDGSFATYDPKDFLDLRVDFRNVEMSPLSAYSVTFAGRRIASGRLGLDLHYKIAKGELAGDNKVELQNFTLGERVEAPGALSLPLDLAVALLTDAQGRIAIAMPVKGDVNNPEFSYGHLVWQAISTVISNVVSAPFRALFGGGGADNVDSIAFDAGRAALLPPEREKLKRVADALGKRPQLKLVIEGQHGEADRAALRRREVASAIALRLENPAAGGEPPPVNARDARTRRALEALFVERNSEQALQGLSAELEKARGKPVDRDDAYYDALLARLNESAPLADDALDKLAGARAGAVAEHLEKVLAVPPARVERKAATSEGERAKLALAAAGAPAKAP